MKEYWSVEYNFYNSLPGIKKGLFIDEVLILQNSVFFINNWGTKTWRLRTSWDELFSFFFKKKSDVE